MKKRILSLATAAALMLPAPVQAAAGDVITKYKTGVLEKIRALFGQAYIMMFAIFAMFWTILYLVYRTGLEKSHQVPTQYVHKLAMVLSFLSMTPLLWWAGNTPNVTMIVKTIVSGYLSPMLMGVAGIICLAITYWVGKWLVGGRATT